MMPRRNNSGMRKRAAEVSAARRIGVLSFTRIGLEAVADLISPVALEPDKRLVDPSEVFLGNLSDGFHRAKLALVELRDDSQASMPFSVRPTRTLRRSVSERL